MGQCLGCCSNADCAAGAFCNAGSCSSCVGNCGNSACSTSPDCVTWTGWINRDDTGGNGDGEWLSLMLQEGLHVCPQPVQIQCRRASDQVPSDQTGEVSVSCTLAGLECLNDSQPDGFCDDYEVRFLCPNGTIQ